MIKKVLRKSTFFKYNLVAITATTVDFLLLIFFTEILHFWYLFSAVIASVAGGLVLFGVAALVLTLYFCLSLWIIFIFNILFPK